MSEATLSFRLGFELPLFRLRLVREGDPAASRVSIKTPREAASFLGPLMEAPEEHFISLHLNARNQVLGVHEVSHGTLSASLVHPREVFKAAVLANSHALLICHNHPSGADLKPSLDDLDTTAKLVDAGKLLGVEVVDHIIVGSLTRNDWYSVREHHPEIWF
ncbi:MAG: JAB domain-containing protein [Cyanobacteria bacterium HKST-UBA02]|nr:JAB domain-containing protein [Cyanobacteria bacterium HKST-UBA02]